ncbi:MAG TPA: DUF6516 family protein [Anaerolineae bacterium]|nr:DUF6516 family protein [Anaerolineae bacterium]
MSNELTTYSDYARQIFFLLADHPSIESHTVAVYSTSQTVGLTRGKVVFHSGHVLRVFEQIDFVAQRMLRYFYELTYKDEPQWWYDSMPHPDAPELQSTHPHHKHVPPDIKHHRIPAAGLSFTHPNLPMLIAEIEEHIEESRRDETAH